MVKKSRKIWQQATPRKTSVKVPDALKKQIQEKCDSFIESTLKPQHLNKNSPDLFFGSCEEIYSKWYRNFFYFYALKQFNSSNNPSPVEIRFARLEYIGDNQFNLAYFRHTEKWWTIQEDISLEECLMEIEINPLLQP